MGVTGNSAEQIGKYGFTHWTDKPVTPGQHTPAFVPQSIADGWECYCSCGEWRAFVSLYDVPASVQNARDWTIAELTKEHDAHKVSASQESA